MPQGVEHVAVLGDRGRGRVELDEPGDRPPESPIADRIERLDRLGADVRVVRSKAPADDPAGLRHVQDRKRVEREVLMTTATLLQNVVQERNVGAGRDGTDQPGPAGGEAHRPLHLIVGPAGERIADLGCVARHRPHRRGLDGGVGRREPFDHARRETLGGGEAVRGGVAHEVGRVLQRRQQPVRTGRRIDGRRRSRADSGLVVMQESIECLVPGLTAEPVERVERRRSCARLLGQKSIELGLPALDVVGMDGVLPDQRLRR
jgi:hypothetical protein